MQTNLLQLIQSKMSGFSKGQRAIASYITAHYDKAAFMTASRLGEAVGVSESTVVRFASELGFDGYPELQYALQEMIRNKLTSVQRMEVASEQIGIGDAGEVLEKVLNSDIEKIRRTLELTSKQAFSDAVRSIINAKTIYIMGGRSASSLAGFLGYYFNLVFSNVRVVGTNSASEVFEQMLRIGKGDVLIAISFPRYSKRTVRACNYASTSGAEVIAITDSPQAPLSSRASHLLLARSDMASFVDSLVAPLSLINALIIAVSLSKKDEISDTFSKLEYIWDLYNVYEKNEASPGSDSAED
ncbi:MAG: MurR/RpiR family transcriptional regulator [Acetanaerobacterium sp.]